MKRPIWRTWGILSLPAALGCNGAGNDEPKGTGKAPSAVVYGQDNRCEPYAYPAGSQPYAWARSSALLVGAASLRQPEEGAGFVLPSTMTLQDAMTAIEEPLCPEEPFQNQPVFPGVCSAFLVGPDTVITAGHCVRRPDLCPYIAVVFGVGYDQETRDPRFLGDDDVYFCEHLLARAVSPGGADYAILKVDRTVVGREPLPLRCSGQVDDDEELVLIGNPLGLPTKIASAGRVLDNTPLPIFKASTDSFGGESGSAVFGARSGLVEGVLVRGDKDFVPRGDCWVSKVCPDSGSPCRGEDVTRATELPVCCHGTADPLYGGSGEK